jgi:hypothetical protein
VPLDPPLPSSPMMPLSKTVIAPLAKIAVPPLWPLLE